MEGKRQEQMKALHDYAEVRGLVDQKKYAEAVAALDKTQLEDSTKTHLRTALESNEEYVIERTFEELDSRIMQALCWKCWRD